MNRILKGTIFLLMVVAAGLFLYAYINGDILKKPLSPKDTVEFKLNDLKLEVFYNRPSKRDRNIFGGLVPYKQIWRTGANEATTFETNKDLRIGLDSLPKGKYTLWTIPDEKNWLVIFNSKQYPWGVDDTMQPMREPEFDVLSIEVPVQELPNPVEQFTIAFDNSTDNLSLTMAWDRTKISVPLK
ncbi:MAG: DUF2911 domain-containing protein [Bacteroidia bacterium]|nr:DUF2911 domain-containing protein [Bacteroidia bacterium]NND26563.1 DUF2911 domain-containing protein [Flavobacteriaceae bacterium]MBT8278373.1 DUF2911 domain-containing protein [Bacteroidia bacterium]NNK60120.1 DUF2911 domain-containing protein [Flavobacteriaceae bacterium]NNL33339.1 DUF2911 domain-containing protein [Flavobacteriaceae bacterium]